VDIAKRTLQKLANTKDSFKMEGSVTRAQLQRAGARAPPLWLCGQRPDESCCLAPWMPPTKVVLVTQHMPVPKSTDAVTKLQLQLILAGSIKLLVMPHKSQLKQYTTFLCTSFLDNVVTISLPTIRVFAISAHRDITVACLNNYGIVTPSPVDNSFEIVHHLQCLSNSHCKGSEAILLPLGTSSTTYGVCVAPQPSSPFLVALATTYRSGAKY
jgi:hypothetical protein